MTLSDVRDYALALPEVTEEPHFDRTSFRIRGKIFATAKIEDNTLNVMAGDAIREPALAMYSDWLELLMWGKKACGLRVNLSRAKQRELNDLLQQAWAAKAPKKLLAAWLDANKPSAD